jgi:hypothetical protein
MVAVVLCSVTLFSACAAPEVKRSTSTADSSKSPAVTTAAPKVATGPLVSKLHQTYVLDDRVQYAIDSVEKSKYLGQTSKGRTAAEGNLFYIVRFRAKNNGNNAATIKTENLQVKAVDGESYAPSDNGKDAVLMNGGPKDLFECEIEPGAFKPFLAIFDLPVSTVESGVDLVIPSTKPDSKDRWVVRLDNSKRHH